MPHIHLPESLPGISAGFAFRPETSKPMRQLAHILLHEPSSLSPGERELIATYPNLHLMQSLVRDRIIYRKSVRDGLAVVEYKPHDELADAEMQSLYEEVFGNG